MPHRAVQARTNPTATRDAPTLDRYWTALQPHLRAFAAEEQRLAIVLYRELAMGERIDETRLSGALGIPEAECRALLQRDSIKCHTYADGDGRIAGFGGLAVTPMHHRFAVDGRQLWTWCAWDSLFIPEILGRPANVASPDPDSGEVVRLVVTPEGIASRAPDAAVISFIWPDASSFGTSAANVMAGFCHFIYFFASRSSGERWAAAHPGTFLYTLEDAFALAKRLNARNFGAALHADGENRS
jgi:alkylmercury lyase